VTVFTFLQWVLSGFWRFCGAFWLLLAVGMSAGMVVSAARVKRVECDCEDEESSDASN
jgi:hypothetical protein